MTSKVCQASYDDRECNNKATQDYIIEGIRYRLCDECFKFANLPPLTDPDTGVFGWILAQSDVNSNKLYLTVIY